MKTILYFLFISFTFNVSAQECNYEEYYGLIKLAKKQSEKKEYKLANSTFKNAFSGVDFPLGQDLGNALLVAQKTNDEIWAKEISIKLAKGGVPIRYFTKLYKMSWYKDFKTNFKSFSSYHNVNYNIELREKWIALILKDKDFNLNRYHAHREARIKTTLEELIAEASEISKEFVTIVETYGFPHEKQMGYLYIQGENRITDYRIDVVIRHIYQRGETVYEKDIDDFICEGKLREKDVVSKESIGFNYGEGLEKVLTEFYNKYVKN
ncbi:hypothetical protein [Lacinutrix chionoecetis]